MEFHEHDEDRAFFCFFYKLYAIGTTYYRAKNIHPFLKVGGPFVKPAYPLGRWALRKIVKLGSRLVAATLPRRCHLYCTVELFHSRVSFFRILVPASYFNCCLVWTCHKGYLVEPLQDKANLQASPPTYPPNSPFSAFFFL